MKLNHLNLTVTDVNATRTFLHTYFGMRDMGGNNNMAFLADDNDMVLSLTSMKVGKEPSRQHSSWTFYFRAPGGFVIEVLC